MLSKLKLSIVAVFALMLPMAIISVPTTSAASIADRICEGANLEAGTTCEDGGDAEGSLFNIINSIIDLFSLIIGFAAVIMILYGGFKYITSAGDSGGVSSAKNTIMYAIIGLVVVVIAQFVVNFVLVETTKAVDL